MTRRYDADVALRRSTDFGGVIVGVAFLVIGYLLSRLLGLTGLAGVVCTLATGVTAGLFVRRFPLAVAESAGRFLGALMQPSGRSTPYEPEFSAAQALAASGDVVGALRLYEREMADLPTNEQVRVYAAELYAKSGDARRAEALLLEVRGMTSDRGRELYATQRVIDLRLGALGEPGRALPELRRLVDRFPGTPEAAGARAALANLKRGA
jgi:thioredoxin-like negative regulator of GroEL